MHFLNQTFGSWFLKILGTLTQSTFSATKENKLPLSVIEFYAIEQIGILVQYHNSWRNIEMFSEGISKVLINIVKIHGRINSEKVSKSTNLESTKKEDDAHTAPNQIIHKIGNQWFIDKIFYYLILNKLKKLILSFV